MAGREARWVRVDRSSSALQFDGSSGLESGGNFTDSLEFVFSGSEVIFWVNADDGQEGEGQVPPPFNFTVDGVAATFALNANMWRYSWEGEATSNPRTALFNRTGTTEVTMSVIIVWYLPSPTSPPLGKGSWAEYTHSDPRIEYKGTWKPYTENGEIGTGATQTGSSLELRYTGSNIWWEGRRLGPDVPAEFRTSSVGAFNIDGGEARPFYPFLGSSGSHSPGDFQHAIVQLNSEELSFGEHVLTLVTNVDTTLPDPPVVLFTLLIEQGGFLLAGASETTPAANTTSTFFPPQSLPSESSLPTSPLTSPTRSISIGAIVGGVIGGTAGLLLLIIALLWARRSKARKENVNASYNQPADAFFSHPVPSPTVRHTSQNPSLGHQNTYNSYSTSAAGHNAGGSPSIATSSNQPLGLSFYRKGQQEQQPYPISPSEASRQSGSESQPLQEQDSGVRLRGAETLPPVYTMD
ncbi:hypothetical protein BKA70DRAFT_1435122 [Coprinopsis sp. MPI-PUGE-AT-0042]|nr:hypothetical protein BKA70DRAFT_1435122 [Coprinopsis sp. MPI-PUGE-AT-0042]